MKPCSKCGGPNLRSGQRYCRSCHAAYMRENRPKDSELSVEARHKKRARQLAGLYQRRGHIQVQSCEKCGNEKAEKHHEDYDKPLEVRWLCRVCHMAEHAADELIAQRRLRTPFEKSTYTGLRSRFQVIARKYSACDYVKCNGSFVRKLSAREIAEFQRGVQQSIKARR